MFPADLRPPIARASQLLAQARFAEAEGEAQGALSIFGPNCGEALFLIGLARAGQDRTEEAVALMAQAIIRLPPSAEAWYALGSQQMRLGRYADAEQSYAQVLALAPGQAETSMALGFALLEQGRAGEAETVLQDALRGKPRPMLAAGLAQNLALAQARQSKHEAALASVALAESFNPRQKLHGLKGEILAGLNRFEEALEQLRAQIALTPQDETLHKRLNDLLYLLGRDQDPEFLASYDRLPGHEGLQAAKAGFLLLAKREVEAQEAFAAILARNPAHEGAAMGAASALDKLGRHDEAAKLLDQALARNPDSPTLCNAAAATALLRRDPEKAVALSPFYQYAIANLGTAWRLLGDERDETLSGYESHIRVFDLEPPEGFSGMDSFNAELLAELESLHPPTREFLDQSLRGGTQTRGSLFTARHPLVDRLRRRFDEAVQRYIDEMKGDAAHPLLARRGKGFSYSGSWSSRLSDCGFHVNHIHPAGWISSCYYAGVPEVVRDEEAKQGWIKFGEPAAALGLSWRRALQPQPGRLVLFPSYMWHGTIAFQAPASRTTIAFDAVPTR